MRWLWLSALIIGLSGSREISEHSEFSKSSELSECSEFSEFSEPSALSPFSLTRTHDSLYHLNEFRLPYPVYRFCTGDVNGDGSTDALVGVIKRTRFHRDMGRRIFIFKQVEGKVRPLWMGSKLGGILQDFRVIEDQPQKSHKTYKSYETHKSHESHKPHKPYNSPCTIRALETTADGRYVVSEYHWEGFGLAFDRFLIKNTDQETAYKYFNL
jgi:hypothetical protein